jgi:hypothetical protein
VADTSASPVTRRKARGQCPVCGTEQALRVDGMLHAHHGTAPNADNGFGYCKGGTRAPVDGTVRDPEAVPTWDECIARLLGRLRALVAEGSITINDARTIRHLADAYR